MNPELCHTLALGSLVKGYFHNLKGTIQALSLQLQILYMKKDTLLSPQAHPALEKALQALQKLQTQIELALSDVNNDNPGPWDLKEVMEKELLFWEANLFFKHKVTKEIVAETEVKVTLPLNVLRGTLCVIEETLYPALPESSHLKITVTRKPNPVLIFSSSVPLEETVLQKIENLAKHITLFELKSSPQEITLTFKT